VDPAQLAATTPLPGIGSDGAQEAQPQPEVLSIPETSALASSQQLQLRCECGVTLETDQSPGTSVQCPSCSRLLVVPGGEPAPKPGYPQPEDEGIEFQCMCGCTLASAEPPGTEVQCPSCGRMVIVPHDMGETQQVVADMVAAAAAPPPPPPPPASGGMVEFACVCGTTLASSEPPGTEVSCPTCQRIVAVPAPAGVGPGAAPPQPAAGGQSNVGLYILIGVAVLAVVIIGSVVALVVVLGKKSPKEQPTQQPPAATADASQIQAGPGPNAQPAQQTPAQAPEQGGAQKPATQQKTGAKPAAQAEVKEAPANVETAGGIDDMIEQLGSKDYAVRDEAEDKLGDMGNDATDALRSVLTKGKDENMRMRAARSLRRIGTGDAVGALKIGLKDKGAKVRKTCARSLGAVGGEAASALPNLIDALTDKELEVRETVSDALESIGEHIVDDAGDLVEVSPKKLQAEWRKWFEAGAKPDKLEGAADLEGAEKYMTEEEMKKNAQKKAQKKVEKKAEKETEGKTKKEK